MWHAITDPRDTPFVFLNSNLTEAFIAIFLQTVGLKPNKKKSRRTEIKK